jgi:hypothetical protein
VMTRKACAPMGIAPKIYRFCDRAWFVSVLCPASRAMLLSVGRHGHHLMLNQGVIGSNLYPVLEAKLRQMRGRLTLVPARDVAADTQQHSRVDHDYPCDWLWMPRLLPSGTVPETATW